MTRYRSEWNTFDEFDPDPSHRPSTEEELEFALEAYGVGRGVRWRDGMDSVGCCTTGDPPGPSPNSEVGRAAASTQSRGLSRRAGQRRRPPSLEKP